jgi:hypothetical protein
VIVDFHKIILHEEVAAYGLLELQKEDKMVKYLPLRRNPLLVQEMSQMQKY